MACGRKLVEEFGGEVPRTVDELVTLPGVGRKTANMVRGNAFGQQAIAVDTHVLRVANRLGWRKRTIRTRSRRRWPPRCRPTSTRRSRMP